MLSIILSVILVAAAIAAFIAGIIFSIRRKRSCSDCSGCPSASNCGKNAEDEL